MLNPYILGVATQVFLFAAIASSYNLLLGFSRLFSVAQGAFVSIGAYSIGIGMGRHGLSWPLATLIGTALSGVAGAGIGLLALRVNDDYLAIGTVALQIVMTSALSSFDSLTGGTYGLPGIPTIKLFGLTIDTPWGYVGVSAVVLAILMELARRVRSSPFGLILRATGEDQIATRALGKRPRLAKVAIVTASGAAAGFVGAFYASYLGYILPATFDINFSILLLSIVVVGGAGSLWGPLVGSVVMVALPAMLNYVGATSSTIVYVREVFFGIILLLVVVVLKRGIVKPRYPRADETTAAAAREEQPGALVEGRGLQRSFGGIRAVKDVNLTLRPGRVTGIVGPNGAGKTTLFDLLTGVQRANAGTVSFDHRDLHRTKVESRARAGLLRSFQSLRLFAGLSALENVMVAVPLGRDEGLLVALCRRRRVRRARQEAAARARAALTAVGLTEGLDRAARDLSYAEQKLLSLARALAARPRVLLLDEPASGLDPATVRRMTAIVRRLAEEGRSVCVVEHNTQVLSDMSDELLFLHLGEVLALGAPAEITTDPKLASIYFGVGDDVDGIAPPAEMKV